MEPSNHQLPPNETKHEKRITADRTIELFFAGAIVVFTFCLAWVSWGQWTVMQGQLDEIRLAQRAWVGPKQMKMVTFDVNKPITVQIVFSNSGKTPGRNFAPRTFIHVSQGLMNEADMTDIKKRFPSPPPATAVLFPNFEQTSTISTSNVLTEEIIALIKQQKLFVHVFGYASYRDIFDKEHLTKFCGFYKLGEKAGLTLCKEHNEAN